MNRYFFALIGRDSAVFAKEARNIYLTSKQYNFVYAFNDKHALDEMYGRQRVIIFDAGRFGYNNHAAELKSRINHVGLYHPYVFYCSKDPVLFRGVDDYISTREELERVIRDIDRKLN